MGEIKEMRSAMHDATPDVSKVEAQKSTNQMVPSPPIGTDEGTSRSAKKSISTQVRQAQVDIHPVNSHQHPPSSNMSRQEEIRRIIDAEQVEYEREIREALERQRMEAIQRKERALEEQRRRDDEELAKALEEQKRKAADERRRLLEEQKKKDQDETMQLRPDESLMKTKIILPSRPRDNARVHEGQVIANSQRQVQPNNLVDAQNIAIQVQPENRGNSGVTMSSLMNRYQGEAGPFAQNNGPAAENSGVQGATMNGPMDRSQGGMAQVPENAGLENSNNDGIMDLYNSVFKRAAL